MDNKHTLVDSEQRAAEIAELEMMRKSIVSLGADKIACAHAIVGQELELARLRAENADLAMLVRRLARHCNSFDLAEKAMDYLHRKGLQGSVLR